MEQRTEEWFEARMGCVTASRTADVMAKTKSGYAASRANYMAELICERLTGERQGGFSSAAMQWGTDTEPQARMAYEIMTGATVIETGFVLHPEIAGFGASPDGLIGNDGLIEIKCPRTKTHMKYVASQTIPAEYKPQMILQSACTGKDVWFVSYDPRMGEGKDLYIKKFCPTAEEIAEVEKAAEQFLAECDALFDFFNEKSNYFDKGAF